MRHPTASCTRLALAAAPLFALAGAAALPRMAAAHCVMSAAIRWDPGPGPIPVYVSTDSVQQTTLSNAYIGGDLSADQEIRWVKAAIDLVNAASTDAPRLYYAGTDATVAYSYNQSSQAPFWSTRNEGITISSYGPCGTDPSGSGAAFSHEGTKGAIRVIRGGSTSQTCIDPSVA